MAKYWMLSVVLVLWLTACGASGAAGPEPPPINDGPALEPAANSARPTPAILESAPNGGTDGVTPGQVAGEAGPVAPIQAVTGEVVPGGSVDLSQLTPAAAPATGGEAVELPAPGAPRPEVKMASLAMQDLGSRLGIDVSEIAVVKTEAMEWPDAGLGCPAAGMMYAAVITPGYLMTLLADDATYLYHTDTNQQVALCVSGQAAPPVDPS